jgi:hypothetical protein
MTNRTSPLAAILHMMGRGRWQRCVSHHARALRTASAPGLRTLEAHDADERAGHTSDAERLPARP